MNKFKKSFCVLLSIVLLFGTLFSSAGAVKPTKDKWFVIGDINYDGSVTPADARSALRISAFLDAAPAADSVFFFAGDIDEDGEITVRDARMILRISSGLDAAPAQIPNPLSTTLTKTEAVNKMNTVANSLKKADSYVDTVNNKNPNYRLGFKRTITTTVLDASAKYPFTLDPIIIAVKNECNNMISEAKAEPPDVQTRTISSGAYYYNNWMELYETEAVMALSESMVKSHSSTLSGNRFVLTIYLKDENISGAAASSNLAKVMTVAGASDIIGDFGESDEMMTLGEVTNNYKNSYIKYTMDAVSNKVITAEYYTEVTTVTPITFKLTTSAQFTFTFVNAIKTVFEFEA